jgi:hypothetical protein
MKRYKERFAPQKAKTSALQELKRIEQTYRLPVGLACVVKATLKNPSLQGGSSIQPLIEECCRKATPR